MSFLFWAGNMEFHHVIPWAEIQCHDENLIVILCHNCHMDRHGFIIKAEPRKYITFKTEEEYRAAHP
jgi:hypothetical protein